MRLLRLLRRSTLLVLILSLSACPDPADTDRPGTAGPVPGDPASPGSLPPVPPIPDTAWTILECPRTEEVFRPVPANTEGLLWTGAGLLQVPPRFQDRVFRLIEGRDRVELGIELVPAVTGPDTLEFLFDPPATLTMSFARCPDAQVPDTLEYGVWFYGRLRPGQPVAWHQFPARLHWNERLIVASEVRHLSRFVVATRLPAGSQ